jgi:hypothetical protein
MNLSGFKGRIAGKPLLAFIAAWTILFLVLGYPGILKKRPVGIHQWAQCDRGSVARNYAEESMNFFLPRVNASQERQGISGMEFPLMNYLAAVLYKVFGFNEGWYRLLMMLAITCGACCAFLITLNFVKDQLLSIALVVLWYVSPVLVYYTPNFIPDTASLGFMMIAWYCYFRLQRPEGSRMLYLWLFLFAALASLIKITSLMGIMIMAAISLFEYFRKPRVEGRKGKQAVYILINAIAVAAVTYSWYRYADMLNRVYKTPYFLMRTQHIESWEQALDVINQITERWLDDYYTPMALLAGVLMLLTCIVKFRYADRQLLMITLLYFAGILCFFVLMGRQFTHHDYYIITLLPFPFFVMITFFEMVMRNFSVHSMFLYFRFALILIILVAVYRNTVFARTRLDIRYQAESNSTRLFGMEEYLRSLGIERDHRALIVYDCSPNITLYYFNIKGWNICYSDGWRSVTRKYAFPEARYVITNDADSFDIDFFTRSQAPFIVTPDGDTIDVSNPSPLKMIGARNGFTIYEKERQ